MPFRKVSRVHQDFVELMFKVADKLCLRDIDYVIEIGTDSDGNESFLGGVYKVQISGYKYDHKVKYQVIVKWNIEAEKKSCFRELYLREFAFYQHVIPDMLQIQSYFKIIEGLKMKFPNCIFASNEYDKETIIVQNLLDQGFRFHHRLQQTDVEHASLAMKNLAKLHALSFVLERCYPDRFIEIKQLFKEDVQYSNPCRVSKYMETYFEDSVNVVSDRIAREKLRNFAPHFLTALSKCTRAAAYSTICHADCWYGNILFKYQRQRPVDVVFIDYQLSRIAPPVTDISYFLYMSAEKELLTEHHEYLLNIYYATLTAVLRNCNLNVTEIYPKAIFERHLREYSVLGLIEALVSMKIITTTSDVALEMADNKYVYGITNEKYENSLNVSLYVKRVNVVVNDFFARGYSLDEILKI